MQRLWIGLGSVAGFAAVATAAFAAHGLTWMDQASLQLVHTAIEIQAWHALVLLACGLWAPRGGRLVDLAGGAFALGQLLFCGALYGLALAKWAVPMLAPSGGTLLLAGWVLMGLSAIVPPRRSAEHRP